MFVSVAIDLALDRLFTYSVPVEFTEKLRIGQLLRVPFSGRIARGFAMKLSEAAPDLGKPPKAQTASLPGFAAVADSRIKPILGIEDESPFFSPAVLELVKWIAQYTVSPLETCLRAAVPAAVLKPNARPKTLLYVEACDSKAPPALTKFQARLLDDIRRLGGGWLQPLCRELKTTPATLRTLEGKGCLAIAPRISRRDPLAGRKVRPSVPLPLNAEQVAALESILNGGQKPVLLHGVTGSGKTEVYLQAIARALEAGRGAIVLVPEISLTPQTVRRFVARFGDRVAVLHSALSDGERYDEWHRIRKGEAAVVVGPRSAIFAPVRNLGLIVVDEEHDSSYKQDEMPRYHARDIAVMRGRLEGCRVVLGSATPSLESWLNAKRGKYAVATIANRVAGRSLPMVNLVDMEEEYRRAGRGSIFSTALLDAIWRRLERAEQVILFLNRRGYARVYECAACGHVMACPKCSTLEDPLPYTYHLAESCLRCHACGGWEHLPNECPECHSADFSTVGFGTQRAEAALMKCFPSARVLRMDADSTSRKFSHDDILSAFRDRQADILIGTQMIAKGLDFPNVTLVGVLNADTSLNMPDFRASERTYQLLAQVSGRAGRAEKPGEVFLQTVQTDAPAIVSAARGAYAEFADAELVDRKEGFWPPYSHLAVVALRSADEELVRSWAEMYSNSLSSVKGLVVSEAIPSLLAKVEGVFRWQVTIRAEKPSVITAAYNWLKKERPAPDSIRVSLDMDAMSLV